MADNEPGPIPEGTRTNFQTMLKAADAGRLCLLSCKDKATGEDRAAICMVNEKDENYDLVPVAIMVWDNPYELLTPPSECETP